ncbi:MAG: hypothetical protein M3N52_12500 [Actinomycetota bacterium]|nr:hypothetical protein [Actinomycetota bacterium]
MWSFVVALVLFVLGSLFSLYEGVEKVRQPPSSSRRWSPSASWSRPSPF